MTLPFSTFISIPSLCTPHFSITLLFTPFIWWLVYLWLTFPPPYKYDCNHYPHVIDSCVCVLHLTNDNNIKLDMWPMPCLAGMKARWICRHMPDRHTRICWIVCIHPSTVRVHSFKKTFLITSHSFCYHQMSSDEWNPRKNFKHRNNPKI